MYKWDAKSFFKKEQTFQANILLPIWINYEWRMKDILSEEEKGKDFHMERKISCFFVLKWEKPKILILKIFSKAICFLWHIDRLTITPTLSHQGPTNGLPSFTHTKRKLFGNLNQDLPLTWTRVKPCQLISAHTWSFKGKNYWLPYQKLLVPPQNCIMSLEISKYA